MINHYRLRIRSYQNIFTFIFLLILFLAYSPAGAAISTPHRPRVAVVLSGGGVKGAAHVGILRAVEEAGLPIDYIVGTSMGAIVGGLYAMGYTTTELDSLFRKQDWSFVLSDQPERGQQSLAEREWNERFVLTVPLGKEGHPRQTGLLRGQNLGNLLARLTLGYHTDINFDSLPIPFACVATNLSNGAPVVLRRGIPAMAIRASMAIPGVFTPIVRDGMTLVDGGLSDNYPVDVARNMGADIVIGSTVQKEYTDTAAFSSVYGVLEQVVSIMCRNRYEENIHNSDLCLRTPVTEYSTMDFSAIAIDTILARGYATGRAAQAQLDSLNRIVWQNATDSSTLAARSRTFHSSGHAITRFKVNHIRFKNILPSEVQTIRQASRLHDFSDIDLRQIEEALRLLRDRFLYIEADYVLIDVTDGYDLEFRAHGRSLSKVGVGARFDTEEMAAILLDADFILGTHTPSRLNLLGKLGEQYFVRLGYQLEPKLYRQLSLAYEFHHSDLNVNRRGHRAYNLSYQLHTFTTSYAHQSIRNFGGELGLKFSYYDYGNLLSSEPQVAGLKSDLYFTGFMRIRYNSHDKIYFPTRGSHFNGELTSTTDNLSYYRQPHAFQTVRASWETVCRAGKQWVIIPALRARMVWGRKIPLPFVNTYGGLVDGRYVEQQLAFVGVSCVESSRSVVAIVGCKARYNIAGKHYATALVNVAAENDRVANILYGRYLYGIGLQYGLATKFGPVSATCSYSNNSRRLLFYASVGFDF